MRLAARSVPGSPTRIASRRRRGCGDLDSTDLVDDRQKRVDYRSSRVGADVPEILRDGETAWMGETDDEECEAVSRIRELVVGQ